MTEQMEEDEDIFKKLKIPWIPEEMHPVSEGKCIDSENENLHRSITQYKYHIEYLHEINEGLVTTNRILREYLEIPVAMIEQMEEDGVIFKELKIPWMPEEMHPTSEGKCIDSENENL